ncbi:MAG: FN3 domain-containing metallophosphoesterase family protein [Bacteroidota bacterium]|nr:FN3 domain-containing metallophosphoesterase family protein [Bacteroidota bacterium]
MKRLLFIFFSILALNLYAQQDKPIAFSCPPYLQELGTDAVTIVWHTTKPAFSWVELAEEDGSNFQAKSRTKYYGTINGQIDAGSTIQKIRIKGLKPGTTYNYRLVSKEILNYGAYSVSYGSWVSSDNHLGKIFSFSTLPEKIEKVSFIEVSDIHNNPDKLEVMLKNGGIDNADLVLFNGDMTSEFSHESDLFDGFLKKSSDMFAATKPFLMVRGNHETRGLLSKDLMKYFPRTDNKYYFTKSYGPLFLIGLDCGEDKPDSDIAYSGLAAYDEYRTEQAEWLKKVFESSEFKNAQYKVVICHISPLGGDGWHAQNDIKEKWLPILNKAGITLMLCGHEHTFNYFKTNKEVNNFPIIIGSDKSCTRVDVSKDALTTKVIDYDGKNILMLNIK